MIYLCLGIVSSYLIGAIPTAYIFAKILRGTDIRGVGSGNVGATNVYRAVGKIPGFIVLVIDIIKGVIPVLVIPQIVGGYSGSALTDTYMILIGASVIIGHVWNVFLRFKGGKGVATTAGVIVVIAPKVVGVAFLVWLTVFIIYRYVSLASIAAAVSLPVTALLMRKPASIIIFLLILSFMGIYKHKSNIGRLKSGEERKLF